MAATWTVHRTRSTRFPFRVAIEHEGHVVLAVRAPSPWPGPGQQIFCLREDGLEPDESLDPVESVPVANLSRVGRKLAIVLDRPMRKRCEFLFISKAYRSGEGTYEQVFFRTESGIRSHRSRSRLELQPREVLLDVVIDSGERYPWRFPQAKVTTRRLPAGDYALVRDERLVALVERKSFDNLLGDLGAIQALHHHLADLSRFDRVAVVVEAQYADFLDARRLEGRWPSLHVARALAELAALHPRLPVVFAGNRKLANQWAYRFFVACATEPETRQLEFVKEVAAANSSWDHGMAADQRVRAAALTELGPRFEIRALVARCEGVSESRVRRILKVLEREGKVRCLGRGRGPRWVVVESP